MTITGGYYIKARCVVKSEIAHCAPAVRELWDYLLREANHAPVQSGPVRIARGQLIRSISDIQEGLSWFVGYRKETYSEDAMKRAMKKLRDLSMIASTNAPGGMLITVCNYEYYQDFSNYERTGESTNERTSPAPGSRRGRAPINNEEEVIRTNEKERNNITPLPPEGEPVVEKPEPAVNTEKGTSKKIRGGGLKSEKEHVTLDTPGITPAFQSQAYRDKWAEWEEYRRQARKPRYTKIGLQATQTKLFTDSDGIEGLALKIIDQSIAGGWTGLFPLKQSDLRPKHQPHQNRNHSQKFNENDALAALDRLYPITGTSSRP